MLLEPQGHFLYRLELLGCQILCFAEEVNGGCWFEGEGITIHCGVEDAFLPARRAHPALLVENLGALVAKLEACGVGFKKGKPLEGYRRGDIQDPFGNRIELMEKL